MHSMALHTVDEKPRSPASMKAQTPMARHSAMAISGVRSVESQYGTLAAPHVTSAASPIFENAPGQGDSYRILLVSVYLHDAMRGGTAKRVTRRKISRVGIRAAIGDDASPRDSQLEGKLIVVVVAAGTRQANGSAVHYRMVALVAEHEKPAMGVRGRSRLSRWPVAVGEA